MPVVSFTGFSGIAPRVDPRKLPPGQAQVANNVRLTSGALESWYEPLPVLANVGINVQAIYRFGQDLYSDSQYWFVWDVDVDVVKGAIADDQTERTLFTHPTLGPRQTNNSLALTGGSGRYPYASYPLGIPRPGAAPAGTQPTPGTGTAENWVYAYTYVSILGEEGPPSPTSADVIVKPGQPVIVTGLGVAAPAGHAGYLTAKRIYRTFSGNSTTEFRLVDEIPISQANYTDSIASSSLQSDVIETATWNPPPAGAFGITQMANGITIMFKGYEVYVSEAFKPYAYPTAYRQTVDYPIVGGKAVGTSALICTTGHPYLLTGSDPSAMSLTKLENPQACVSKRSIAAVSGGVMYASPDGLVLATQTGQVEVLTEPFFTHEEWQLMNPTTMRGFYHDGRYIGAYTRRDGQRAGFVFDPAAGKSAFTLTDVHGTAGFTDVLQDALFLVVNGSIVRWNGGAALMNKTWKSGVVKLPQAMNLACAKVRADAYPLTFTMWADGVQVHTQTVANKEPFWLPGGMRYDEIEVQIAGQGAVMSMHLATSPQELRTLE